MNAPAAGGDLFYATHGRGTPMLVLHGAGVDHTSLRPWLDPLGSDVELVYYNQRGSGRSPEPSNWEEISRGTWVEEADALREYLGHEQVLLFGHSFGGALAAHLTKRKLPDPGLLHRSADRYGGSGDGGAGVPETLPARSVRALRAFPSHQAGGPRHPSADRGKDGRGDIARALCISWHTARRHVERVLHKLGVHSRAAVATTIGRA